MYFTTFESGFGVSLLFLTAPFLLDLGIIADLKRRFCGLGGGNGIGDDKCYCGVFCGG